MLRLIYLKRGERSTQVDQDSWWRTWHDMSIQVDPLTHLRHEILSSGKRGVTSPYGDFWRKWRKVRPDINSEMTDKLITSTRMYFGVATAQGYEWEGCATLSRTTDT